MIITSIAQNDPLLGTNAPDFRKFPLCQATVILVTSRASTSIIKLAQKWLPPKSLSSNSHRMVGANLQNYDLRCLPPVSGQKAFHKIFLLENWSFQLLKSQAVNLEIKGKEWGGWEHVDIQVICTEAGAVLLEARHL